MAGKKVAGKENAAKGAAVAKRKLAADAPPSSEPAKHNGRAAGVKRPKHSAENGHAANGHAENGHVANGQAENGVANGHVANGTAHGHEASDAPANRRQAVKGVSYKETKGWRETGSSYVQIKEEAAAANEAEALEATGHDHGPGCRRRLLDFDVHDKQGTQQPLDSGDLKSRPLFLTGAVYPGDGKIAKEKGRRVKKLGPVTGWSIKFASQSPEVCVTTAEAMYSLGKAATAYRAIFEHLSEAVAVTLHCYMALAPSVGGNPQASLSEVVAKLARAKVGKSYATPREALLLNAKFVTAQLSGLDGTAAAGSTKFSELPFLASLIQEGRALAQQVRGGREGGPMTIREPGSDGAGGAAPAQNGGAEDGEHMETDEDFARQLQAKLDAEEARRGQNRGGRRPPTALPYIKVHESEIADDYPMPSQYTAEEDEADELVLFGDEEDFGLDPEHLPRRQLSDFSIYNAEGFHASLELLPMWSGVDPDVELFASGRVLDDDGEWSGGQTLGEAGDDAGGSGAGGSGAAADAAPEEGGMRVFLSQIREWVVDFSADMLFISLRTDVAWYRLSKPAGKYNGWFATVLKTARLAVHILKMLSEETRASRLSFNDIIKRLAQQPEDSPTHISKKVPEVERFVVVHGQIILNQFKHFPNKAVKSSAFPAALRTALEMRRHLKLYASTNRSVTRVNRNPMKDRSGPNRLKPMPATATAMVKAIWASYFQFGSNADADAAAKEAEAADEAAPAAQAVEEDENEEEEEEGAAAEVEDALAEPSPAKRKPTKKQQAAAKAAAAAAVAWVGAVMSTVSGAKFYGKATVGKLDVALGEVVQLAADEEGDGEDSDASAGPALGLVQAMWQSASGVKNVQLREMLRGSATVLGDAASETELFLTDDLLTRPLGDVMGKVRAERRLRAWGADQRRVLVAEEAAMRRRNAEAANASQREHHFSKLYLPHKGMFCEPPRDLELGTRLPEPEEPEEGLQVDAEAGTFKLDGVTVCPGDTVFVLPDTFDQCAAAVEDTRNAVPDFAAKSRHVKGGANHGLRAYGIGEVVALGTPAGKKGGKSKKNSDDQVTLRRFYRPEDISRDAAYRAAFTDVYKSEETLAVPLDTVVSKCSVLPPGETITGVDCFTNAGKFDRKSGKLTLAKDAKPEGEEMLSAELAVPARERHVNDGVSLATLDIFAGCGGLSEGLAQAGAAESRWAIEYEHPAAEAFKLNHPKAATFCANCNVILARAMQNAGAADELDACEEARAQAEAMDAETAAALPLPGQVDMIVGGPPCQGYSGMNRFNKRNWSMVQNSMVMAYLSFADFYRPRFFLLENVRNFVSHNKSFTFRLTLRSLLDMGYQVRFGVLNAGNFGVAQSRKRTFIIAAAPDETMPDWPEAMHVFASPQLTINLPGGVAYTAVPAAPGRPRRAVTVRDAIGDLPPISNGADVEEMPFSGPPQSAFQREMRDGATMLRHHISKEMNELNLERCRCIPTNTPGADWRCLEALVRADPSREKFKGQPLVPWCLPNTAERHNGWRGLFGRLDWRGHFPTSTTDPQPMGKVGQVFHPDQDRIISVRECARAQGFPDSFRFYGNVHAQHRQIGNAVPPPLAAALGRQLRKVLQDKADKAVDAAIDAGLADL